MPSAWERKSWSLTACGDRSQVLPLVLEVANQLALLGVYADDGQAALGEFGALLGDVAELVAVWVGTCRDALVVDAQPVVEILEDAGDRPGTDLDVKGGEFCCDLLGGAAGPADTGDGIAGDVVLQGRFDGGDHLGSFFSRGGRPPPGRRTRSRSMSWASSCLRPRATVPGSIPSSPAIRASPPPTALEGLKAGVQPALAFVEQAGEQHDSGAQLVRHEVGIGHRSDQPGGGQQGAPVIALSCCVLRVRSAAQYKNWPASFRRVSLRCWTSLRRTSWVPT